MADHPNLSPGWCTEARALIALSIPLIVGNLGWSLVAATDLLLLGRLGPDAVAAGSLALNLYVAALIFGMGLSSAAAPLIASERGRRLHSIRDIRRTVRQTAWASVLVCLPCWMLLWHAETMLIGIGQEPVLATQAADLLRGLQWGLLPYLLHLTLRHYIGALERPIWGVLVTLAAVPVNTLAGWLLIFGHGGLPPLGLFGAGLASSATSVFMFLGMVMVVCHDRRFRRYRLFGHFWRADWPRFREVWRIGLPIAITLLFEITIFNAAVFLMGLIGRSALAAHAIAIQIASLCFMVPLGLAQAATVRVGYAHGQRDAAAVARAGGLALVFGIVFAALSAAVLVAFPLQLIGIFIDSRLPANGEVVRLAAAFLSVAAFFQFFDCTQAVGAGVLRGLQDTRVPMMFAAIGYWVIGLGVGTALGFHLGMGGVGVWLGLATGLGTVAVLMVVRWLRRERLGLVPAAEAFAAA